MPKNRQQKREEAKVRNEKWSALTPEQQLASLDKRGLTATRQREKIQRRIDAMKKIKS